VSYLGPLPSDNDARPWFTVERSSVDPPEWSVYSVTPHGGVGARCYGPIADKREAEAWAVAAGALADPIDEAA
jgi:hypothetical protein